MEVCSENRQELLDCFFEKCYLEIKGLLMELTEEQLIFFEIKKEEIEILDNELLINKIYNASFNINQSLKEIETKKENELNDLIVISQWFKKYPLIKYLIKIIKISKVKSKSLTEDEMNTYIKMAISKIDQKAKTKKKMK